MGNGARLPFEAARGFSFHVYCAPYTQTRDIFAIQLGALFSFFFVFHDLDTRYEHHVFVLRFRSLMARTSE